MANVARYKNKIIITGASGYIGKKLHFLLKKKGVNVLGLSRRNSDINIDLLNKKETIKKLKKYNSYEIIHCAGFVPKNQKQYKNKFRNYQNFEIAKNLLATNIKKIYFISSFAVYQNKKIVNDSELKPNKLENEYSNTKIKIENLLLSCRKDIKILRIPGIFGGERKSGFIYNCIKFLKLNKEFFFKKKYPMWVGMHIDDLVKVIYEIINKNIKKKILNICYKKNYTINETINLIYKIHGKTLNLERGSFYKITNRYHFSSNLSFIRSLKKEYMKV